MHNTDNIDKIMFTISLSHSLSRNNLSILESTSVIDMLSKHAKRIHDINFTYHIEPFTRDAHGVYINEMEMQLHIQQLINIQEKTGILISPVFNNIYVSNSNITLSIFIENFKKLYDLGVRSVTIPHILWMKTGRLKITFPDLKVKNTVLRRVRNAQEFWNFAEAGFDYVNIDRILIRDYKTLQEIRKAQMVFKDKTGKYVFTSILTGEGCPGTCPLVEEHHQHSLTYPENFAEFEKNTEVFRYPQQFSCLSTTDNSYQQLTSVNLPQFTEDLNEICQYFDIIKLPGRRAFQSLMDGIRTIEEFVSCKEKDLIMPNDVVSFLGKKNKINGQLNKWRETIKNCRFQCWNCNICSNLYAYYLILKK